MPYVVLPKITPLAGFNPTFSAGIWVPPPADGSNPGGPDDVAVVTSDATGTTLTFPTLAGPPSPPSAMTMTNLTGDLFRSGPVSGPLPASPAPLTVFILPVLIPHKPHAIIQSDLDAAVARLNLPRSFDVPLWVQYACGIPTLGFYTPKELTILTATLTLPAPPAGAPALNLNITGTLKMQHWGPWSTTSSVYFAMSVKPTPSGDPVATSRIFAMPVVTPNPSLGISGVPGIILGPIANWLASMAASMIEGMINQSVASQVPPALAHLQPPFQPQMLAPTAVVSAVNVVILPSGIDLFIAVGDLFGPGLVPIPGNLTATIEPMAAYNTKRDYVVTVRDTASNQPVEGATVELVIPVPDGGPKGTTDANGQVHFDNVTLATREIIIPYPPYKVTIYSEITATAANFNFYRQVLYSTEI